LNPQQPTTKTPDTSTARRSGPLQGVRVLDLSRVLTGPFCSMILADLGAEVWKVEELRHGDQTRAIPPFVNGESHYYMAINRNKTSLAVNLKTPEGRAVVLDLAAQADVLLENFRPGVMERLGLGHDALRARKADLIICSITGFGQKGPMSHKPSFDLVAQALSGVMSINGEPSGPPTRLGIPMGDIGGGLWAAIAVLAALQHRNSTGEGLHVDLSLVDGLIGLLGYLAEIFLVTGDSPGQVGNSHHNIVPYGCYPVKDGHIVLALFNDAFWRNFCLAAGRSELIDDDRFRGGTDRVANRAVLEPMVADILMQRTMAEWHEIFDKGDVPHGPVNTIGDALTQPLAQERGMIRTTEHPRAGKVDVVGTPIQFQEDLFDLPAQAAPLLGEHSASVLQEVLGYSAAQIQALTESGVIEHVEATTTQETTND